MGTRTTESYLYDLSLMAKAKALAAEKRVVKATKRLRGGQAQAAPIDQPLLYVGCRSAPCASWCCCWYVSASVYTFFFAFAHLLSVFAVCIFVVPRYCRRFLIEKAADLASLLPTQMDIYLQDGRWPNLNINPHSKSHHAQCRQHSKGYIPERCRFRTILARNSTIFKLKKLGGDS